MGTSTGCLGLKGPLDHDCSIMTAAHVYIALPPTRKAPYHKSPKLSTQALKANNPQHPKISYNYTLNPYSKHHKHQIPTILVYLH